MKIYLIYLIYLSIYLSISLSLSICLSVCLSIYLSVYLSIRPSIYPCFSLSVPSTAALQLFKDQLFSGSTHNLLVYFSSTRLSSYLTCFLLHLALHLFTCPGLSLCPYTPIIMNQGGQKSRTQLASLSGWLSCQYYRTRRWRKFQK